MNSLIGNTYLIFDKLNRNWGTFKVEKVRYGCVHGKLAPTSVFSEVRPLFQQYDRYLTENSFEYSSSDIVELGVYLVEKTSNQKIDISDTIYISSELLVTCKIG